jgi:hypothetical protein
MRGAVVGTRDMPFRGHLAVRVINDVRHETFTRGVIALLGILNMNRKRSASARIPM